MLIIHIETTNSKALNLNSVSSYHGSPIGRPRLPVGDLVAVGDLVPAADVPAVVAHQPPHVHVGLKTININMNVIM